ncbi:hypothetical protein GGS23DRAFT_471626 [Durotheca rogersii]|uniref:uncharacterized protein n=1 Tax=Durotheca rogersii TaxID=419775 RepID=UPI002220A669|nr:uncharacterized protein GGS23DRAFT_471626 [Durotheca rogersii]KAI5855006.1 hypothetical protein GGS23DRAFT_471626 [Durotheca rogersii]
MANGCLMRYRGCYLGTRTRGRNYFMSVVNITKLLSDCGVGNVLRKSKDSIERQVSPAVTGRFNCAYSHPRLVSQRDHHFAVPRRQICSREPRKHHVDVTGQYNTIYQYPINRLIAGSFCHVVTGVFVCFFFLFARMTITNDPSAPALVGARRR